MAGSGTMMRRKQAPRSRVPVISWPVVLAVSFGGGLGALARWGLSEAVPHGSGQWPTATLLTNLSGCALIGVLMVVIAEVWPGHRLVRPFLGVGVLGGFTTFSTYAVDVGQLAVHGKAGLAVVSTSPQRSSAH